MTGGEGKNLLKGGVGVDILQSSESEDQDDVSATKPEDPAIPTPPPGPASYDDRFASAQSAMDRLAYLVDAGFETEMIRDALDNAAETAVDALYALDAENRAKKVDALRLELRTLVNLTGDTLNWGEWTKFNKRLHSEKARLDTGRTAHGLEIRKTGDGYDVLNAEHTAIFTLPKFAGSAIAADPKRYAPRLLLLQEALAAEDPDALHDRASALLNAIAQNEHSIGDGTLVFGTADARAGALVTWLKRRQTAETPEARQKAENVIRAVLFAEADPGNRLAAFGLNMAPFIGNLRSGEDAVEGADEVLKALDEGRYMDATGAAFWTALDGLGAVTGIGLGKAAKAAARETPVASRYIARHDLWRMKRCGETGLPPINAKAIMGPKYWNRLTKDEKSYLIGILPNAKGIVGEEQARVSLKKAKASGKRGVDTKEGAGREVTEVEILPQHRRNSKDPKVRYYDEILDGAALKRSLGKFLRPVQTPGKRTLIEIKTDAGQGRSGQRWGDGVVRDNLEDYKANELLVLRMPYDDISKAALRKKVLQWMRNPEGAGMKRVKGEYKTRKGKKIVWTEEQMTDLINSVDRSLARQALRGYTPTIGSFITGLAMRMAAQADE